jgi:hypothetical protein
LASLNGHLEVVAIVLTLCGLRIYAVWNPAHATECRRRGWLEVDQHAVPFDSSVVPDVLDIPSPGSSSLESWNKFRDTLTEIARPIVNVLPPPELTMKDICAALKTAQKKNLADCYVLKHTQGIAEKHLRSALDVRVVGGGGVWSKV